MKNIQIMYSDIRRKYELKLKRFCRPLKNLIKINQFYHYRLTHSGHYAVLGLYTAWEEYFFSEKFHLVTPYFRHPKYLKNCVVLPQALNDEKFNQVLCEGGKKFNVTLSLQIMHKTAEGIEAFGFGLESSEFAHHVALYNELPLLRLFVDCFRQEFQELPLVFEEQQIDIGSAIGASFFQPMYNPDLKPVDRSRFLKQMGLKSEISFSPKEIETLKYILNGFSASQIAEVVHLSTRTIQHRIERLKGKLDCFSKTELIQKARLMEELGEFF